MKKLDEIMVSESTLKMLLGGVDIGYRFPTEINKKGQKRKRMVSLQTILKQEKKDVYGGSLFDQPSAIRSFDSRFDKKHPVQLMVDFIKQNSIRKDMLSRIYGDSKCIKAHRMVGPYAVYNSLLTEDQKQVIEDRLKFEDQQITTRMEMAVNFFK